MAPPTLLEQWTGVPFSDPVQAVLFGAGAVVAVALLVGIVKAAKALWNATRDLSRPSARRTIFMAVGVVALAATVMSNKGIRGALHKVGYDATIEKVCAFVMFEVFMAISAGLSYRQRMKHPGKFDPYRYLTFGLATLMAAASWWGEGSWFAAIPAYVAALAWEIALAAEQAHEHGDSAARSWLTRMFLRAAVALRLWTPTEEDTNELDRQRRITRYVRCVHRLHNAEPGKTRWRGLRRPLREALEEKQQELMDGLDARGLWDQDTEEEVERRLYRRFTAVERTAPEFIRHQIEQRTAPAPAEAAPTAAVAKPVAPEFLRLPALPAAPVLPAVPAAPRKPRRAAGKISPADFEAAFKRLYLALGKRPSVRQLGDAAPLGDDGAPLWSKSTAHKWMTDERTDLAALEAEALAEAAADLEGASA